MGTSVETGGKAGDVIIRDFDSGIRGGLNDVIIGYKLPKSVPSR